MTAGLARRFLNLATTLFSSSAQHSHYCSSFKNLSSSSKMVSTAATASSDVSSAFEVSQFKCLSDNYGFLLHDKLTGATAAIDSPSSTEYLDTLQREGWTLTHILNTHHHADHTGANLVLKQSFDDVTIYGPIREQAKIPGIDKPVGAGDTIEIGSFTAHVLDVGGHTKGHVAYYFPEQKTVFVGDSLFALGCGKMFEGTPQQFWKSLVTLRDLPDDTTVYCAHEYTESNSKFAMHVEPNNPHLVKRVAGVKERRARGEATVPFLMKDEKMTNPFLRVDKSSEIRANVGVSSSDPDSVAFGKLRKAKDNF